MITSDETGAGDIIAQGSKSLGTRQTAFDAEIAAIDAVTHWYVLNRADRPALVIHSDSTSAIARAGQTGAGPGQKYAIRIHFHSINYLTNIIRKTWYKGEHIANAAELASGTTLVLREETVAMLAVRLHDIRLVHLWATPASGEAGPLKPPSTYPRRRGRPVFINRSPSPKELEGTTWIQYLVDRRRLRTTFRCQTTWMAHVWRLAFGRPGCTLSTTTFAYIPQIYTDG